MTHTTPSDDDAGCKRKILLISCTDLRQPEPPDLFHRTGSIAPPTYHMIFAGSSLGFNLGGRLQHWRHAPEADGMESVAPNPIQDPIDFENWSRTLREHLLLSLRMLNIEEVYILEHEDCNAYDHFIDPGVRSQRSECECQQISAYLLAEELTQQGFIDAAGAWHRISVQCLRLGTDGTLTSLPRPARALMSHP